MNSLYRVTKMLLNASHHIVRLTLTDQDFFVHISFPSKDPFGYPRVLTRVEAYRNHDFYYIQNPTQCCCANVPYFNLVGAYLAWLYRVFNKFRSVFKVPLL